MKTRTKALLLIFSVTVLVVVSVLGTFSYLTSEDEVVNTFTVGKVKISLDEAAVNTDGSVIPNADRVKGNEYHLVPGQTYVKDPTVTVEAGSEESYVRMLVTVNKVAELNEIMGSEFLPQNYVEGWNREVWPCVNTTYSKDNTVTYEFRYYKTVDASKSVEDIKLEALFLNFTLPGKITGAQLATIGNLEITVEGHAIQKAGFSTADEAWDAFAEQTN